MTELAARSRSIHQLHCTLALRNVAVEYRARVGLLGRATLAAVRDATLDVSSGEFVGIVGESGCGKSTLARVLMGIQRPTRGHLLLDGVDVFPLSDRTRRRIMARRVAAVFQDSSGSLNPRLSVEQLLQDPLKIHGIGDAHSRRARVAELLDVVHLPRHLLTHLPAQISGGQRQRVGIARALALEPQILIADEPTSALDVSVRSQIIKLLLDLRRDFGLGIVLISHDIHTVRYLADRIAVMYLGWVVEQGDAARVASRPRHPYTQALFGAVPTLLGNRSSKTPTLRGGVPSLLAPPSGCPFHPRCDRALEVCEVDEPDKALSLGSTFFCHNPVPDP